MLTTIIVIAVLFILFPFRHAFKNLAKEAELSSDHVSYRAKLVRSEDLVRLDKRTDEFVKSIGDKPLLTIDELSKKLDNVNRK